MKITQSIPQKRLFIKLKQFANLESFLIVGFFVFGFIGIIHHEMWRDEFQAWLLARDSSSIPDLIENSRHEGHPILWHLCLYLISSFTHNPLFMQIFHLLIATGVIILFVKFSPFNDSQKALFTFGYFPFYEYAVISRNYSMGVLFIFLFCILFPKRNKYLPWLAIILAFLANTNAYGLTISFTLILLFFFDFFVNKELFRSYLVKRWNSLLSLLIVISGWSISFLQIARPFKPERVTQRIELLTTNEGNLVSKTFLSEMARAGHTVSSLWKAYVPIPDLFQSNVLDFWGSNIIANDFFFVDIGRITIPLGHLIAGLSSIGLFVFSIRILIRKPLALIAYIFGTFSILLFNYFIHYGTLRHHGSLFILLITCLWISRYTDRQKVSNQSNKQTRKLDRRYANRFLTIILYIHVIAGIFAYSMDLAYPFSMSRDASRFIESRKLDDLTIVGTEYREVATLSGYLDKKIYYPERESFGSFWTTRERNIGSEDELFEIVDELLIQSKTDILLVLTQKLQSNSQDINICPLQEFKGGIVTEEQFYLYLVQKHSEAQNCLPNVSQVR